MQYLDKEIFNLTPLAENDNSINNEFVEVGKEYKKQEKFVFTPSSRKFKWTYAIKSKDEARELRAFVRSNYGRYGAFWLPSYKRDIEFISYHASNLNAFYANPTQRGEGVLNQNRHIYIPAFEFAAKITFVQLEGEQEIITLNKPLPSGLEEDNTEQNTIMNLFLVRFTSDEFKLSKRDSVWFESSLEFTELQKETP